MVRQVERRKAIRGEPVIRPSSLPMLSQCSAFESSGSDFAELGTDRHAALKAHLQGDDSLLMLLDDDDQAGIRWAADYVKANTSASFPTELEITRSWTRPDFSPVSGTPDITNGPEVFDFKWRRRDYTAQMADYAFERITAGFETVTVHVLFGAEKHVEKMKFDAEACERIILPILNKPKAETPCDYCGWCARKAVCPAYVKQVHQMRREEVENIFALPNVQRWIDAGCHTSELVNDAELVSCLLRWSRQFKKIHDGIEHFAKEAAIKHGLVIPGFELKATKGKQFVSDVKLAYESSGLSAEDFLSACAVRLNTSKKYPDQKGLDVVFKEKFQEPSLASAKRSVQKKLEPVLQRGKESLALKSVKGGDEEESE